MARARSFPFDFLKDPDVIALSSDECLILIGMILQADDHGRGFAHSTLLGREIRGYAPEQIESALGTLQALELVTLYQVGRHRYYSLTRWQEWQKLRDPARSKFPAPSEQEKQESEELSDASDFPQKKLKKVEESLEKFEKPQKKLPRSRSRSRKGRGNRKRRRRRRERFHQCCHLPDYSYSPSHPRRPQRRSLFFR